MKITLNDIEEKFIPVRPGIIVAQSRRLLGHSVTNSIQHKQTFLFQKLQKYVQSKKLQIISCTNEKKVSANTDSIPEAKKQFYPGTN